MPSIVDIAPPELTAEEVDIRGTKLKVQGIAGEGWMALYTRHPALRAIVTGRTEGLSTVESFASQVALIAAGLGSLGDVDTERLITDRLTIDEQRQVVETIMQLSMPGHIFGPLLDPAALDEAAMDLLRVAAAVHSTAAPGTK